MSFNKSPQTQQSPAMRSSPLKSAGARMSPQKDSPMKVNSSHKTPVGNNNANGNSNSNSNSAYNDRMLSLRKPEYSPPPDSIDPQQVSDFDYEKRVARETLTLTQRPVDTIILFVKGIIALGSYCVKFLWASTWFTYGIVPFLVVWFVSRQFPGHHLQYMYFVEFAVEFTVWWVGLGILSSVGLGSGLQSGVLFMYPYIIKVCFTAQFCNSLDFESATDMWFRSPPTAYVCPPSTITAGITHGDYDGATDSTGGGFATMAAMNSSISAGGAVAGGGGGEEVSLFGIWQKIILVCFLQATGTALGEIPPYWMTRAARLAAMEAGTDTPEEMPEELEMSKGDSSFMNSAKKLIIYLLSAYGFYGVLLMASFPNIAFDLCGICCGHFLMPFWTFFLATFLGKAVIRNFYQSVIYVFLCSEEYMEKAIIFLQKCLPDGLVSDASVRMHIETARENFKSMSATAATTTSDDNAALGGGAAAVAVDSPSPFNLMVLWKMFMSILLTMFFLSLISHFAQYYQMTLDQELSNRLRRKMPARVRQEISSPNTGRLRLPVPTPLKSKTATKHLTAVAAATTGEKVRSSTSATTGSSLSPVSNLLRIVPGHSTGTGIKSVQKCRTASKLHHHREAAAEEEEEEEDEDDEDGRSRGSGGISPKLAAAAAAVGAAAVTGASYNTRSSSSSSSYVSPMWVDRANRSRPCSSSISGGSGSGSGSRRRGSAAEANDSGPGRHIRNAAASAALENVRRSTAGGNGTGTVSGDSGVVDSVSSSSASQLRALRD